MTIMRPLRYFRLDPFDSLRRLQEEFGDIIWDTVREVSSGHPAINVFYDKNKATLEAELPAVKKEDLEIEVLGNSVTLKGSRKRSEADSALREERSFGAFSRNIQLPFEINSNGVEATLQNGILTIVLPRKEEDKPRKVQISAAK
ncbi:MAG: Hsp20/alpha crystallin family protein [Bdellovibrionota bacterium]|jgi:HSP20 family protein